MSPSNIAPELRKISDFEDKSLLIVDDDTPFRDRLARAMEKKGFIVSQAHDVKTGTQKVIELRPAFAVIDLRLDGILSDLCIAAKYVRKVSAISSLMGLSLA